jgi:hypothetical protein
MAVTARQFAIRSSANQREGQIYRDAGAYDRRIRRDSGFKNSGRAKDRIGELRVANERLD